MSEPPRPDGDRGPPVRARVRPARTLHSEPLFRMLGHTSVVLCLLTLAYFLVPLRFDWNEDWTVGRLVGTSTALVLVLVQLRHQLRRSHQLQSERFARIEWLLTVLYALVLTFALVYTVLATRDAGQFVGLEQRTDGLYFSVTVVSTVGFGDIHAQATVARLLVTVHMLFNLIYLGTALRVLTGSAAGEPRTESPSRDEDAAC